MTEQEKFDLVRSVGEECVTEAELKNLLAKKPNFILYDGFEPSGRMHIAQGVFKAFNVNKCTKVTDQPDLVLTSPVWRNFHFLGC